MTETAACGLTSFKAGDSVEVKEGWDHHRGWIQPGTKITLTSLKASGEWIGAEHCTGKTITIPANTEKHVKKI